jgi:hypothetical protein
MKIGLILECQNRGPDEQVLSHFVKKLCPDAEVITQAMGNKPTLLSDCGEIAQGLLGIEGCDKVFVIWDLWPAWGIGNPCMKQDRELALESLNGSVDPPANVHLGCIIQELEAWLIADGRAVTAVINDLRRNRPPISRIRDESNPETVQKPKQALMRLFKVDGKVRKYDDWTDAIRIARALNNFHAIEKAPAFVRFRDFLIP